MRSRIAAVFLTVIVLVILIMSGPAQAFNLGFSVLDDKVLTGEKADFSISLKNLGQDSIDRIVLKIGTRNCEFDVNGTAISGCDKIIINRTGAEYNYGYGYGSFDNLTYSISLETSGMTAGNYSTETIVVYGNNNVSQKAKDLVVVEGREIHGISIRGTSKKVIVNNASFDNVKLNFYIGNANAKGGEGYITGQKGRTYFSYTFNIDKIISSDNLESLISISGRYRIGIGKEIVENGILILRGNKIIIESPSIHLTADIS